MASKTDMEFRIIDYSFLHFRGRKGPAPASREGKFVQLRNGEVEYLVFSPDAMSTYHANIIARFCHDEKIAGLYRTWRTDDFRFKAAGWKIVGGGYWEVDEDRMRMTLSGTAQPYGKFDPEGLVLKIISLGGMEEYDIEIH
jgi:hypothetical protein